MTDSLNISKSFGATGTSDEQFASPVKSHFNLSISGTFVGTIKLQASVDNGVSWQIVDTEFTAVASKTGTYSASNVNTIQYRFECTAYTSGTAVCSLTQ